MKRATGKPVIVWTVLYDGEGDGPAGDGTFVARYRTEAAARVFADGRTCYGSPARALEQEVSRDTARRWGLA